MIINSPAHLPPEVTLITLSAFDCYYSICFSPRRLQQTSVSRCASEAHSQRPTGRKAIQADKQLKIECKSQFNTVCSLWGFKSSIKVSSPLSLYLHTNFSPLESGILDHKALLQLAQTIELLLLTLWHICQATSKHSKSSTKNLLAGNSSKERIMCPFSFPPVRN